MQEKTDKNKSDMDLFGERLKYARELIGMSQSELSEAIGQKGYQTVSRYERGERFPNRTILALLAESLKTTVEWLMTGAIDKTICSAIEDLLFINFDRVDSLAAISKTNKKYLEAIAAYKISPSLEVVKSFNDANLFKKDEEKKTSESDKDKEIAELKGQLKAYKEMYENLLQSIRKGNCNEKS
ncbi:MAG TPA: helix-turn-helix domain-containing protein [Chitinispirillaceae bacterium]|nr:helix-turn-helix domain-containing protein [Chitinispirillaceae bacterium]